MRIPEETSDLTLKAAHSAHRDNLLLLQRTLPTLQGENAERAVSTIKNLQAQMIRIDTLRLRLQTGEAA